ncbi:MAG: hypothetical protein BJ554DRAFT_4156 [Olpidium bornovanus]|uniref:Anti-proliferative protein domain-containing protein n=1 Tax=Olpidium bornovanus TaxID=278681 RepID=A0A8H8A0B2_9FUNG|nr:MAG: hypothetical protein BJ554DRAFT_4156 [Olpidium bornovanus]
MLAEASSAADLCCRLLTQGTLPREPRRPPRKPAVVTLRKPEPPPVDGILVPAGGGEKGAKPLAAAVVPMSPSAASSSSCSSSGLEPDSAGSSCSAYTASSASTEAAASEPQSPPPAAAPATASPPRGASFSADLLDRFRAALVEILLERCRSSRWDPRMDQALLRAAEEAGLGADVLRECLPKDFIIWIDPGSVSYRVGDHGATVTLMDQGRVIPPTTTPPSAALAVRSPSAGQPSRQQPLLAPGSSAAAGFPFLPSPQPQAKRANPYAAPPRGANVPAPAGLPPPRQQRQQQQQAGAWPAPPQAAFRFADSPPQADVRLQQLLQLLQQQSLHGKPSQPAATFSGSQQPSEAIPQQLMPAHQAQFGLQAHHHLAGIFVQPQAVPVKISSPPSSPHQPASKRPAYIMAN